jgi:hypothetical protein
MFDMTKISFDDLVNQLVQELQQQDAWKDATLQSTGMTLIDLYAYVAQLLLYYIKRSYEEMFATSAQYWASLCRIANLVEAPVKRPIGATGTVTLTLNQASTQAITLPAGTALNCDGVGFYLVDSVVFNPGDTQMNAVVRQGILTTKTFTSNGNHQRQDYQITDANATDLDISVSANGISYAPVKYFGETLDSNQVKVWTSPDKNLNVTFLAGFGIPVYNSTISVNYIEVNESYFPSTTSVWSVVNDSRFTVTANLSNFSQAVGWEDVDSFRNRLQGWFGVGKRAVTKDDFWYMVSGIEGVGQVQVVDVKDNFSAPFREVQLYIAGADGGVPSQTVLNNVTSFVDKVVGVGVAYSVHPVQIVLLDVYVVAYASRLYSLNTIQSNVVSAINSLYVNVGIQQWIATNDIVKQVMTVNGVVRCDVVLPSVDVTLQKGQKIVVRSVKVDAYVSV